MTTYMKITDGITEEVMKKAESELGETPETKKTGLEELRHLIHNEDGFLPILEEWFLLMFLRSQKFDVKKAFRTLKNFYKLKSTYSGTVTDMKPSQTKKVLELDGFVVSPLRNTNGTAIFIMHCNALDPEIATGLEILAGVFALLEIGICEEVTQICGASIVYDFKGITFRKLMHFANPSFLSLGLGCYENTWPCRVKSLHVINQPPYFDIVYRVAKILLSKKIRDRVFIYGENLDGLYQSIPRDILPEKIGGLLPDKIYEEFRSYLYKNESIIDVLRKYTYNRVSYGKTNSESDNSP